MSNLLMTIFGMSFIFLMTTLGASIVFFFKKDISVKINCIFLGFASGIMIAASIWSLILPAIEMSTNFGAFDWAPASIGFILGGIFLMLLDKIVPYYHKNTGKESSLYDKTLKLFLAITIHNIPEGLAVGFAFGAAATLGETAGYFSALGLAIGIGLQNFPEGAAVSLPMRSNSYSRNKSFFYGLCSGAIEPVFAVIGYFLATYITFLQPWLLAFAAGAMFFVIAEDLIPDSKLNDHPHLGTWSIMLGFLIMMILDVALS